MTIEFVSTSLSLLVLLLLIFSSARYMQAWVSERRELFILISVNSLFKNAHDEFRFVWHFSHRKEHTNYQPASYAIDASFVGTFECEHKRPGNASFTRPSSLHPVRFHVFPLKSMFESILF
jgi:hypothetical protein